MKEDIRYIADDGTVFYTKSVCQDYEQAVKMIEAADALKNLCRQRQEASECIRCPMSHCCNAWFKHRAAVWSIDSVKEKFYDRFSQFKKECTIDERDN